MKFDILPVPKTARESTMAKKDFYLIIDTETTMTHKVADFAAVVVDRKGNIHNQCAILVNGIYTDMQNHPLFHNFDRRDTLWGKQTLERRYKAYNDMVVNGRRMIATPVAINKWLLKAIDNYKPTLTAYNLAFDVEKCRNTGIDVDIFSDKFCLWYASFTKWAHTKDYRNFVLACHAFNSPTQHGNMSFKTNAETMARFVLNNPTLADEPHTALEDILDYEMPILTKLLKNWSRKQLCETTSFDWRKVQVRDWFTAK
jgi:hypothetical protein